MHTKPWGPHTDAPGLDPVAEKTTIFSPFAALLEPSTVPSANPMLFADWRPIQGIRKHLRLQRNKLLSDYCYPSILSMETPRP